MGPQRRSELKTGATCRFLRARPGALSEPKKEQIRARPNCCFWMRVRNAVASLYSHRHWYNVRRIVGGDRDLNAPCWLRRYAACFSINSGVSHGLNGGALPNASTRRRFHPTHVCCLDRSPGSQCCSALDATRSSLVRRVSHALLC